MILREIKNMYIKNRLTEGVDFVRKDSLKGDRRAYIDTGITDLSESEYIKFEMDDSNDSAARCMGGEHNTQEGCGRLCFGWQGDSSSNGRTIYMWSDTGTWGVTNNRRKWTLDLVNNAAYTGSMSKTTGLVFPKKVQSFVLFGYRRSSGTVDIRSRCTMWSFEVHNQINLVPCQLLKSIPATLDANNRARSAGECGMYDSVSGKFFGNVANSGTFTVKGEVEPETHSGLQQIYQNKLIKGVDYQTADWLKGDAVAYINTNYLLDFDDIKTSIFRLYNTKNQVFEGSRYGAESNGAGTVIGINNNGKTYSSFFSPNGLMAEWNRTIPINTENTVVMSKNGITLNGTNISSENVHPIVGSRFESVTPYLIFASWIHNWKIDNRRQKVDYKSFEIEGKLHLVPCRLLRSIPRNLDAQCKSRIAGECGMIDLISGKFYGNVANGGIFTVENDNENNE